MPKIGIIDDRDDFRETILRSIDIELQENWQSIAIAPLPRIEDYPAWITEQEVAVLLLDEKLNEQIESGGKDVGYEGHDLVEFLRKHMPTFPLFVVTSYVNGEELIKKFSDVEGIIARDEFLKKAGEYAPRFFRAGQQFLQVFQSELNELAEKAHKIAVGEATEEDIEKANAIREKIGLVFPSESLRDRSEWLKKIEEKIEEFKKLNAEISSFLES
jgi:hypothetical protein